MYSDNFNTTNQYVKYHILAVETYTDVVNNRTKLKVIIEGWRTNTGYTTDGAGTCYVNINGANYSNSWKYKDGHALTYNSYTVLFSWEDWIYHNPDGNKTVYISAYINHDVFSSNSQGYNVPLTYIPRQAALTGAPNFTDEDNPTITYSNPAGNAVSSLKACISWTGADDIKYRDISKTGSSYTFNFTEEEREKLRYATINSPTLTVRFHVTTVLNGVTCYSTKDKILTITNANPVLNPEAKDTGGYSVPLTGNANKIIKGFNYVNVKTNATPLKGSSIKSQRISCGDQVINAGSGGFSNVETGTITFSATDSRGYSTTKIINLEVIPYIKLTCNLEVDDPTTDGKTNVKISGNYWAGNFGAQNNTLAVYFRYKENDGEYSDWVAATANAANDKYTAEIPITGLDYKKAYTFQAKAVDKVITLESKEIKVKTVPVYDWGENDFAFNVPVSFEGKSLIDLIYPVGAIYISSINVDPEALFGGKWAKIEGRFLLGVSNTYAEGSTGGEASHTLTTNEMPSHNHTWYLGASNDGQFYGYHYSQYWNSSSIKTSSGDKGYVSTNTTGGGQPHNNMPPYLAVHMWKRYE
jgi:hypothetical protein